MADYNVGALKGSLNLNVKSIQNAIKAVENLGKSLQKLDSSSKAAKSAASSVSELDKTLKNVSNNAQQMERSMKGVVIANNEVVKSNKAAKDSTAKVIREQNLLETAYENAQRKLTRLNAMEKSHIDLTGQSSAAIQKAQRSVQMYQTQLQTYGRASLEAGRAQRQMMADIQAANIATTRLGGGLNATRGALRTIRGAAGQAGHQIQDVAVQAQMGTDAFIILGQQGSQVLSLFAGFGPLAGAVLAIGAAAIYASGGMDLFTSQAEKDLNRFTDYLADLKKELEEIEQKKLSVLELDNDIVAVDTLLDKLGEVKAEAIYTTSFEEGRSPEFEGNRFMPSVAAIQSMNTPTIEYQVEGYKEINKQIEAWNKKYEGISEKQISLLISTTDQLKAEENRAKVIEQLTGLYDDQNELSDEANEKQRRREELFRDALTAQLKTNEALEKATDIDTAREKIETERLRQKYLQDGIVAEEVEKLIKAKEYEQERLDVLQAQKKEQDKRNREVEKANNKYLRDLKKIKAQFEDNSDEFKALVDSSAEFTKIMDGWDAPEWAKMFEISDKAMNKVITQFKTLDMAVAKGDLDKAVADQMKKGIVEGARDGAKDTKLKTEFDKMGVVLATSIAEGLVSGDWDNIGETIFGAAGSAAGSIFGPAGAAVGEVVGKAAGKAYDDFMKSSWDPTEARQAALGTGTVLGDIDAKTKSIQNAVELSENTLGQIAGINSQMLEALRSLTDNISNLSTRIALDLQDIDVNDPNIRNADSAFKPIRNNPISSIIDGIFGTDTGNLAGDAASTYADAMALWFTAGLADFGDLFGGSSKLKDEGVLIIGGVLDDLIGGTVAKAYADYDVKKNILDDWDKERATADLDDATNTAFQDVFKSVRDSVISAAGSIGLDVADQVGAMIVDETAISLEDMSTSEAAAALNAYFSQQFDLMAEASVPFFKDFIQAGESAGDVLVRLAANAELVESVVSDLGLTMAALGGLDQIRATDYLTGLFGGPEEFFSATEQYFDSFASDAEKLARNENRLSQALAKHNMQLPETSEGYFALRKELELSGQQGADAFATLVKLGPIALEYFNIKAQLEDDALNRELDAIEAAEDAFLKMLQSVQEALQAAQSATDSAYDALEDLVNAQIKAIKAQMNEELAAIKAQTAARQAANKAQQSSLRDLISAVGSELSGIEGALKGLLPEYDPIQQRRRENAVTLLRDALMSGDLTGTGEASELAAQIETDNYKTRSSFEYEQARTINLLDEIEGKAKTQLTTAELQLAELERVYNLIKTQGDAAADQVKQQYDQEVAQMENLLASQLEQINVLRGIEAGVNSIPEALAALQGRIQGETNQQASVRDAINQMYQQQFNRQADAEGLSYWTNEVVSGRQTLEEVQEYLKYFSWKNQQLTTGPIQVAGTSNIPMFAKGGLNKGLSIVGDDGPELINTSNTARIHSQRQTKRMLQGSGNDDAKMSQLIDEVKELQYLIAFGNKYNRRSSEVLEQYRDNGFEPDGA